jgi:hypothetical protein
MLNTKKGISIYLAIIIMALLLAIVLGLNTILVSQIKVIRNIGYSVSAFYAAETGIEEALKSECLPTCPAGNLGAASYSVVKLSQGQETCPNQLGINYCLRSVGIFQGTRRAIQVSR